MYYLLESTAERRARRNNDIKGSIKKPMPLNRRTVLFS